MTFYEIEPFAVANFTEAEKKLIIGGEGTSTFMDSHLLLQLACGLKV
jgi:hypothetical protein